MTRFDQSPEQLIGGHGPLARRCRHAALVLLAQVATATGAARELVFGREVPEDPSRAALSPAGMLPGGAGVTTTR